ncbi:lipopolysaccharide ABC transporter permease LptF [Kosakonia radicincitans DSM 16656]|uniref:Lipopolysaccharide export system permease protein LptF n=1 Tax=Kosakonia radicincitans TaxID=283686 RepID=A0AAX2EXG4_9ENTR|nr:MULTISPECIES: LPS export ABC transporter permease LptF [Kosakonia]MDP9566595.1 lipopolysaccharide export system permease protein [Kosakonia oryzae]NCF07216.1 LPS export ABC transporter permease LptF [Kosakonia sp. MH5]APG16275.1 lipopolysaccharide ABC transporter permease LptF [Kosakonia radicincitans]ARD62766.1 lipopolysaccharide ABC transporter permease LptF [Kosakonia radicincitans DSM 16656]KDE36431.1 lipopolysaccharide ABC transporter permease [Kosakonia radicincitans UMEnt01/12]
MIIIRYLVRETLKSQLAILFILLLIFFCQKLVRILGAAADGEIPTNLVLSLLGLGVPEMAQLILPLSLFLGLLMTLGKLYTESEITVMHACGLSRAVLIKAAMVLALFTGIIAAVNVMWAGPWSSRHQDQVLADAKANPGMAALAQGQFQQATDGNSVLFIEGVEGNRFHNVFLAQIRPKGNARPSVVVADSGQLSQHKDGSQVVTLNTGTRFEGTAMLRDFRITDFQNYQAIIGHQTVALDPSDTEQMDMRTLFNTDNPRASAELHWRLTLIFTVVMMALMVVPLSVVNPRQGRVLSMLPAMLLYLVFFLLQTTLRSNGAKGKLDPMIWMWTVNLVYLALAVVLNLWDTVPMRRVRARFTRRGAV